MLLIDAHLDLAMNALYLGRDVTGSAHDTRAKEAPGPFVVVIDTDPYPSTPHGGHWWDVAVPEVSNRTEVNEARAAYEARVKARAN